MDSPLAFPSVCLNDPNHPASVPGMDLRDWFAGQAINAAASHAFANIDHCADIGLLPEEWAARIACRLADELLAARKDSPHG